MRTRKGPKNTFWSFKGKMIVYRADYECFKIKHIGLDSYLMIDFPTLKSAKEFLSTGLMPKAYRE
jgi:hypothetical protein